MTACTMTSDYGAELMLGSSPVVGSGFHGSSTSFFSDYNRCGAGVLWDTTSNSSPYYTGGLFGGSCSSDLSTPTDTCRTFARTGSLRRSKKLDRLKNELQTSKSLLLTIPTKSCLRQQEDIIQEDETANFATSPTKEKKKVCFADALGQQLAQIKLITERPDCPPLWSSEFIEKVTGGIPPESPANQWELTFTQPASDYMSWKLRLDRENVALENVLVEEKNSIITGTIKVRNLSFHKDVLVRYTTNGWITTEDCLATYIPSPSTTVAYDLYDRFGFQLPLPDILVTDKIQFCIRFSCDGSEYWDSNNGRNYIIISFRSKNSKKSRSKAKLADSYHMDMDSWSEFASWNHLNTEGSPYW